MYLVVIAWLYVVLMMTLAEAFSTQGSLLGATITFLLYGVLPLSLVVYILNTPARKARRKTLEQLHQARPAIPSTLEPDAGGHASSPPQTGTVPTVRKEP